MPTYEYRCRDCSHTFEECHHIDDMRVPEHVPCPNCKRLTVEKVILTAPAIGDPVQLGIRRPDGGFKEVLQKIHHNNYKSNLNTSKYY